MIECVTLFKDGTRGKVNVDADGYVPCVEVCHIFCGDFLCNVGEEPQEMDISTKKTMLFCRRLKNGNVFYAESGVELPDKDTPVIVANGIFECWPCDAGYYKCLLRSLEPDPYNSYEHGVVV